MINNFYAVDIFHQLPFFLNFIFIFIFGSIIGSFLNVVILREEKQEALTGRSACPKCQNTIKSYDLIPVFSWLMLMGRCRHCKAKISIQYPLVEFATGVLFVMIYLKSFSIGLDGLGMILFTIWNGIMFSLLVCMFVFDLYHKIIPDKWSLTFAGLALAQTLYIFFNTIPMSRILDLNFSSLIWFNLLAGIIFFVPFFLLWFLSGGRLIGLGDGKLALGIGWYLGFISGLSAIILGFWIGAVFAIFLLLKDRLNKGKKNITMKTEVPFGPFLIAGILIQFFWAIDVIGVSLFF